jgi:hypothetical protein
MRKPESYAEREAHEEYLKRYLEKSRRNGLAQRGMAQRGIEQNA